MDKLRDILWPIVLVGGLGGLIDFLIGRTGQQKAKDFLLKWWVRFDDVRWKNFGREEGLFAGRLIERWFGRRIWSVRRIIAFLVLFIVVLMYLAFHSYLHLTSLIPVSKFSFVCRFCNMKIYYAAISVIMFFIGFSLSVSFTRFVTFRMSYLCGVGNTRNLIIFLMMLIVNYLMFEFWSGATSVPRELVTIFMTNDWHVFIEYFQQLQQLQQLHQASQFPTLQQMEEQLTEKLWLSMFALDNIALNYLATLPSLFRLILAIVFVGSFLLKPLVMRPINLVWRRIVESEKPVFTLIFGGAGAIVTAIGEAAKHFPG